MHVSIDSSDCDCVTVAPVVWRTLEGNQNVQAQEDLHSCSVPAYIALVALQLTRYTKLLPKGTKGFQQCPLQGLPHCLRARCMLATAAARGRAGGWHRGCRVRAKDVLRHGSPSG